MRRPLPRRWLAVLVLALACGGEPVAYDTPERIIAVAPNLTELLFALGLGDRVVGVGEYCHWPPQVRQLPRLGGLFNPNLEQMVALQPDLAILLVSEDELEAQLRRLGVETLTVRSDTLADIEASAAAIGERCGVPRKAQGFLRRWRRDLTPLEEPTGARVLLSVGRVAGELSRIFAVGPGNFLNELLGRLGAVNVFADAPTSYPEVPLEEVLRRAPQVIVELQGQAAPDHIAAALERDWRRFPQLPAVRSGQITVIAGEHVLIPGPRVPQIYRELQLALSVP